MAMLRDTSRDPIRCIAVFEAAEGVAPDTLRDDWRAADPLESLRPSSTARYLRSAPLESDEAGFRLRRAYGVSQYWVDGLDEASFLCLALSSLHETSGSSLLKHSRILAMATRELAVIDGPERKGGTDGVKAFYFSPRRPDLTVAQFQDHWRNVHGPLVKPSPGITRYVQCHPCAEAYDSLKPRFDALAELTFPDKAAQAAFGASEHTSVNQRNDLPNFMDMVGRVLRFYLEDIEDDRVA